MLGTNKVTLATADAAGSSVASSVSRCFQSFEDFVTQIRRTDTETSKQIDSSEVTDELGRFRVWAGNIGAHRKGRSSLDYRLRDASHIRSKVQSLLLDLQDAIQRALQIIRGERIPWDQLRLKHDSDTDSSDTGSENGSLQGDTELRQLISSIHDATTLLLRLSMTIRNPAPHDQYINSANIDKSHFKQFDKSHVRNKFPEAPEDLVTTLGEAISRRREYFKYRESHNQKLSHGLTPSAVDQTPGTVNASEYAGTIIAAQSTIASSLPQDIKAGNVLLDLHGDHQSESGQTLTSFATSAAGMEGLKVPPMPKEAREGNPFPCPFCFMIISVNTRRSWKKHVFKDLHPYSCTFLHCTSSKRLFERRHEWFQHELQVHRKFWQCIEGCSEQFPSQAEFEEHLHQRHSIFDDPDELARLSALCERQPSLGSTTNCNLCSEENIRLKDLEKHVAKHQEELALFALPTISDDDADESSNSDADSAGSLEDNHSSHSNTEGKPAAFDEEVQLPTSDSELEKTKAFSALGINDHQDAIDLELLKLTISDLKERDPSKSDEYDRYAAIVQAESGKAPPPPRADTQTASYSSPPAAEHEQPRTSADSSPEGSATHSQNSSMYDCFFNFIGCSFSFADEAEWRSHSTGHFGNRPLPQSIACPFQNCPLRTINTGPLAWTRILDDVASHIRQGKKLPSPAERIHDEDFYCHLEEIGMLNEEEFQCLINLLKVSVPPVELGERSQESEQLSATLDEKRVRQAAGEDSVATEEREQNTVGLQQVASPAEENPKRESRTELSQHRQSSGGGGGGSGYGNAYYCCQCLFGPMLDELYPQCLECGAICCGYCSRTTI